MEDINMLTQIISTVGFPIVMSLVLFWYVRELNNTHKAETDDLRKAIEANTIAITRLSDKMDEEKLQNENI